MTATKKIAPPNSLLVVTDVGGGDVPQEFGPGPRIAYAPSCLLVGTLMFMDGETAVVLTDEAPTDLGDQYRLSFDGELETPSKEIQVCTVEWDVVLTQKVPSKLTRVQVWANHPSEPDHLVIVVGKADEA